jgi:hypothetical protein
MNLQLIEEIGALLFKAVELGVQYGPQVLEGLRNAWHWATTSDEITPEQQAAVDAAFEAAHAQVQAAGAALLAPDQGDLIS